VVKVTEKVAILSESEEDVEELLASKSATVAPGLEAPVNIAQQYAHEALKARPRISPLVRKLAADAGVPCEVIGKLPGSGPEGAVSKTDFLKYLSQQSAAPQRVSERRAAQPPADVSCHTRPSERQRHTAVQQATSVSLVPTKEPDGSPLAGIGDQVLPLTRMRRAIADRMTFSTREAPQFWLEGEANFSALIELRNNMNQQQRPEKSLALSYTDFVVKAVACALEDCPFVNVSYSSTGIIRRANINIGIAVALDEGLMVPVISDADKKTVSQLAQERAWLAESARKGTLVEKEITGGSFTVSNLGMFQVNRFAAILNPPEAGILSVGRIRQALELRDGQVIAVPTVSLGLTIDHRAVDGAQGAKFLGRIVERLQAPYSLLA
jgi:pyruvate dehydrogenase E2 component (dihydrolipoamide acetyltransferase)